MLYTSERTYGLMIAAAISGWFGTLTALPMSCSSDANTTSSSAPARSARVAVCSECVSWSTANPSVIAASERSSVEHALGDPVLVLVRLLADHRPLLGGRLVHTGEGLRHGAQRRSGTGRGSGLAEEQRRALEEEVRAPRPWRRRPRAARRR